MTPRSREGHVRRGPDTANRMLLRRDGSIDFRVLAGRVGFFLGTTMLAVGVGALIALGMS